ncbi:YlcI/YnfO family protein [Pantoea rwandensis]|uniref:YlcI/YnfO family protein n=1 Tax=Pantoea rwandensis TaxID=1076550 RepID=UPI000A10723D|nr:YlcI/YnfO family protein [Pantoea rwandensis]
MDKMTNAKTRRKHIRFPHLLIDQIEESMKIENSQNFSAWVVEACRLKAKEVTSEKK